MNSSGLAIPYGGRAIFVATTVIVAIMIVAGWIIFQNAVSLGLVQRQVRDAEVVRARVLSDQLDEESGIRGYAATQNPLFLEPYNEAAAVIDGDFGALDRILAALSIPDARAQVDHERTLHAQWVQGVVAPLTLGSPLKNTINVELRGKQLTDIFHLDDARIADALSARGDAADRDFRRTSIAILVFAASGIIGIVLVGTAMMRRQMVMERALDEQRMLYENERRVADALQEAFLAENLPAVPRLLLSRTYHPASAEARVGGDWYDAFDISERRLLISIGDVAGHGLEAAILMNRARQSILISSLHEERPGKVLEQTNRAILVQDTRMVTAICGFIDPEKFEINYATAGHPPPILVRSDGSSVFLPHDGLVMGTDESTTYRDFTAQAQPGELLVLYTDGLIEYDRDIVAGEQRLLAAASKARTSLDPANSILNTIFADTAPVDDVAILTVSFRSA